MFGITESGWLSYRSARSGAGDGRRMYRRILRRRSELLFASPDSFGTAAFWEESGVSPPQEMALMYGRRDAKGRMTESGRRLTDRLDA